MLGRDRELAELTATLARVVEGRSAGRVVIVAPPGVGKSRLLAEFSDAAGTKLLRARGRPQGTAPYETVAQLFAATPGDLASSLAEAGVGPTRAAVILGHGGGAGPECE